MTVAIGHGMSLHVVGVRNSQVSFRDHMPNEMHWMMQLLRHRIPGMASQQIHDISKALVDHGFVSYHVSPLPHLISTSTPSFSSPLPQHTHTLSLSLCVCACVRVCVCACRRGQPLQMNGATLMRCIAET